MEAARYSWLRDLRDTILGRLILARDNERSEFVAIKIFKKNSIHRTTENMHEELRIHALVNEAGHPNILRFLDRFEDDESVYAVFEWCGGGDIFEFVAQHRAAGQFIGIDTVRAVITSISSALQFLHSLNIAHRDVSIENILFTDEGVVQLCDFGIAAEFSPNSFIVRDATAVGKIRFMSPEVFLRQEHDAALNDVWCLGVCMFMMLTGAPPHDVPHSDDARFAMITSGQLRGLIKHWKLVHIPDAAIDLVQRMLLPESERIHINEVLQHRFLTGAYNASSGACSSRISAVTTAAAAAGAAVMSPD